MTGLNLKYSQFSNSLSADDSPYFQRRESTFGCSLSFLPKDSPSCLHYFPSFYHLFLFIGSFFYSPLSKATLFLNSGFFASYLLIFSSIWIFYFFAGSFPLTFKVGQAFPILKHLWGLKSLDNFHYILDELF